MTHFLTPRQPLFLISILLGATAVFGLPTSSHFVERAAADTPLKIGDQISTPRDLGKIPDGQHQLCSEPEPDQALGAGTCYWFNKVGNELIGYYGIPHSDLYIDCVRGTIQEEKVIGEAIVISWVDAPLASLKTGKLATWKTLTLDSGKIEHELNNERGEVSLIKFNKAVLSLQDFYRYSPEKAELMSQPPSTCSVKEWVNQIASL